jgi:broad specificity phosphatase PhoE
MGRRSHDSKRAGARIPRFSVRLPLRSGDLWFPWLRSELRKTRVLLIRHGQTEFNRVFSVTRQDPGIRDPHLTDQGRRQAQAVAGVLVPFNLGRLITSPYARALETAGIIAEHLRVPIRVETLIAERFSFICDIGSPLAEVRACWPDLSFDLLPDPWWPQAEETEEMIWHRSQSFRLRMAGEPWPQIGVATHWGFIRALTGLKLTGLKLTGLKVPNGAVLRIDPTRPGGKPELLFVPEAG